MKMRPFNSLLVCVAATLVVAPATAQENTPTTPAPASGPVALPQDAAGQPVASSGSPGKLPQLDEIIAEVLKSSPDVQVAEAQLQEAQAKLRQARMQAVQKATEAYQQRMLAQKDADTAKVLLDRLQQQQESGTATDQQVLSTQRSLAGAQAEIARYSAELQSMLGSGMKALRKTFSLDEPQDMGAFVQQTRPTLESVKNEEIKDRLKASASIEFDKVELLDFCSFVSDSYELNMVVDSELPDSAHPITVRVRDVPLERALLAVADSYGDACFVIRDYGIFVTTREKAKHIAAPCIPDTVPLYVPAQEVEKAGNLDATPKPRVESAPPTGTEVAPRP